MDTHIEVSIEGLGSVRGLRAKDMLPLALSSKVEQHIIEMAKEYIDQEYQYPALSEEIGHSLPKVQVTSLAKSMSHVILDYCERVWLEGSNDQMQIARQLADRASDFHWVRINLATYLA